MSKTKAFILAVVFAITAISYGTIVSASATGGGHGHGGHLPPPTTVVETPTTVVETPTTVVTPPTTVATPTTVVEVPPTTVVEPPVVYEPPVTVPTPTTVVTPPTTVPTPTTTVVESCPVGMYRHNSSVCAVLESPVVTLAQRVPTPAVDVVPSVNTPARTELAMTGMNRSSIVLLSVIGAGLIFLGLAMSRGRRPRA
jgi:hypothetical protein